MQVNEIVNYSSKKKLTEAILIEDGNKHLKDLLIENLRILDEDFDLRQVSGGDWMVWNTETNSPAMTTRFATAGEAEEQRDILRRRAGTTTGRNQQPSQDQNGSNKRNSFSRQFRNRRGRPVRNFFRNFFRRSYLMTLAAGLGLTVDHYSDYDDRLQVYWDAAQAGRLVAFPEGKESLEDFTQPELEAHLQANLERYDTFVARAYGLICAAYAASLTTMLVRAIRNRGPLIRRFFRVLRTIRNASSMIAAVSGAVAGAGVGGVITGFLTFALGTAAIWIVEWILLESEWGESLIEWIVNWTMESSLEAGLEGMNLGHLVGTVLEWLAGATDTVSNTGVNIIAGNDAESRLRDISADILSNPRTTAQDASQLRALTDQGGGEQPQGNGQGQRQGQGPEQTTFEPNIVPSR